ncbi:MAG: DUF4173 domain-containing protein [Parvibaculaceae bacterium]
MTNLNTATVSARSVLTRFWMKAVSALLLVLAADQLFLGWKGGSTLGLFGLVLLLAVWMLRVVRPDRVDYGLAFAAFGLCIALLYDPGRMAALLLWSVLAFLVLRPTLRGPLDLRRWLATLGLFSVLAPWKLVIDLFRVKRVGSKRPGRARLPLFGTIILPVIAVAVFGGLLIWANPILERAFNEFAFSGYDNLLTIDRVALWIVAATMVWALLRSTAVRLPQFNANPGAGLAGSLGFLFSLRGTFFALILCNILFSVQNALDIAFLWGGGTLPDGMTYAEYAQRGAQALIVTALLAGFFALIALRQGSESESNRPVRLLVYMWFGQNVFLVASAIERTLAYVAVYALTPMRLAALLWMGLVAVGLILIVWRIVARKSGLWLVNANVMAAAALLYATAFIDLSGLSADYNVRHARDVTGEGVVLDVAYMRELGPSALPALDWFIANTSDTENHRLAVTMRGYLEGDLAYQQGDWRTWTVAGYRLSP